MYRIKIEASINENTPREAIWRLTELMDYYETRHGDDVLNDSSEGTMVSEVKSPEGEVIYNIEIKRSDEKIDPLSTEEFDKVIEENGFTMTMCQDTIDDPEPDYKHNK